MDAIIFENFKTFYKYMVSLEFCEKLHFLTKNKFII